LDFAFASALGVLGKKKKKPGSLSANIAPSERLVNGTIVTAAVDIVWTIGLSSSAAALRGIRFS
jgi:hypothetical protein